MRGPRKSKSDIMLLCKYLLKYRDWSTGSAVKELRCIDFIRNNYTETTLITYIGFVKHYVQTGIHRKSCTPMLRECIESLVKVEPGTEVITVIPDAAKKEETVKNNTISNVDREKQIEEVDRKLELLERNYAKAVQDNRTEHERLVNLLKENNHKRDELEARYIFWKNKLTAEKNQTLSQQLDKLLLEEE